ncbi:MAG: universal stress protein [Chloroflexia bacterium]
MGADIVVISTHGRSGLPRHRHGSVAMKAVQDAAQPVVLACANERADAH